MFNLSGKFIYQAIVSSCILIFCFTQIHYRMNNTTTTTEWSMISAILGYWFPSPVAENGRKKEEKDEASDAKR